MRVFSFALGLVLVAGSGASAQVAQTILTHGKVVTVDPGFSIAEAVAVADGKILAVGTSAEVEKHSGPNTRVIDLGGRTVIPGLIDSHIHVIDPGTTYSIELSWAGVSSLETALKLVREAAQRTTPGSWIVVIGGWDEFQFAERRRPTPEELNAAAPNHAVYVQHLFDWAALTPLAVQKLKLEPGVALPANGEVHLNASGQPTGIITGNTGTFLTLVSKLPKPTFEKEVEGIREYLLALTRVGVTTIIDADGRSPVAPHYGPLLKLWQEKKLPLRVAYYVQATHRGKELPDYQDYTQLLTTGFGDDMLRFNGIGEVLIWGMHDGGCCGQIFNSDEQSRESLYQVAK
jgi:predicted amidohydrolase YtcJ